MDDLTAGSILVPQNIQATLLTFTIQTIVNAIKQVAPKCKKLIVCGGGAKNSYLMAALSEHFFEVVNSDLLGYDNDKIEAMMMAWLAHKRCKLQKINLTTVTGAKRPTILGALNHP